MAKKKPFANDSVALRSAFPMLVPVDASGLRYDGMISVFGKDFRIQVKLDSKRVKSSRPLVNAIIQGDVDIAMLIEKGSRRSTLHLRLSESPNLETFLKELVVMLEEEISAVQKNVVVMKSPNYYKKISEDLNALGWDKVVDVDEDLSRLHLVVKDDANREHVLILELPAEFPIVAPKAQVDLPGQFHFIWEEESSLSDIVLQFERLLKVYQQLWDEMDQIRENTWVLEPENPRRCDLNRRLALGGGASLLFTVVDPLNPCLPPNWQMLGSEKIIGPLQNTLDSTFETWDKQISLLANWRRVLGIELPSPRNTKREDVQIDCGICYVYKLDGKIPDRSCEDSKCNREYHSSCLYEWLRELPTSRRTFNVIFGECPYCDKPISCQF